MANHVLSLEIPSVGNTCVMRIFDTSVYSPQIAVFEPKIYVTVPGYNTAGVVHFKPESSCTLTACDLGLQTKNCGTSYVNLPDGIYVIKYVVDPSQVVYVEYNHLRMTQAMNLYQKILCDIDVSDCDPPAKVKDKLNDLRLIKMYLEAAKSKVETCHEHQQGMTLYNYALKLLNKLDCKNC
tara:strand:- start:268 stop:810 length:543 start_codon:yes stop_codon:yes gene_type:complete